MLPFHGSTQIDAKCARLNFALTRRNGAPYGFFLGAHSGGVSGFRLCLRLQPAARTLLKSFLKTVILRNRFAFYSALKVIVPPNRQKSQAFIFGLHSGQKGTMAVSRFSVRLKAESPPVAFPAARPRE